MTRAIFVVLYLVFIKTAFCADSSIAIVGDSLSTGALASEEVYFEPIDLKNLMDDKKKISSNGVTLAPPLVKEMQNPLEFVIDMTRYLIETESFNFINKSYAYLLAKQIGPNSQLIMAARNGAQAKTFVNQIKRVIAIENNRLPKTWLVGFHGNDFCSLGSRSSSYQYIEGIRSGLSYLDNLAVKNNLNATVYLISPIAIGQLVVSNKIINKKVKAYGRIMSCKELAKVNTETVAEKYQKIEDPNLQMFMRYIFPTSPANYCPALFLSDRRNMKVGDEIQQTVKGLQNLLKDQKYDALNLKLISSPSKILFDPIEIANDCMHLSSKGHEKVFKTIFNEINASSN